MDHQGASLNGWRKLFCFIFFIVNLPVSLHRSYTPTVFIGFRICLHFIAFGALALSSFNALALGGECWVSNKALVKGNALRSRRAGAAAGVHVLRAVWSAQRGWRLLPQPIERQGSPPREFNVWLEDVVRESSRRSARRLFCLTSKNFWNSRH